MIRVLRGILWPGKCERRKLNGIDKAIDQKFQEVRAVTHSIANKATISRSLVEEKHRSIRTAEAALDAVRGSKE